MHALSLKVQSFLLQLHVVYNSPNCQFSNHFSLKIAPFTRTPTSRRINIGTIKDRAVNQKCSYILWTPLAPLNRGKRQPSLGWLNVTCLCVNARCWGRIAVSPSAVSVSATPAFREEVVPRGLVFNKPPPPIVQVWLRLRRGDMQARRSPLKKNKGGGTLTSGPWWWLMEEFAEQSQHGALGGGGQRV